MDKIEVSLSPEMRRILDEAMEAGEFASLDEALNECVRVWKADKEEKPLRHAMLKARIEQAIEDPRPPLTSKEVKERMEKFFQERRSKHDDAAA
jgi:antitoxin ParD1/3/4